MRFIIPVAIGIFFTASAVNAQYFRVDPSFSAEIDGPVFALAVQPDGKILIGGIFTNVNGIWRPRLARLHADGSLDGSFLLTNETLTAYVDRVAVFGSNIYARPTDGRGVRKYSLNGNLESIYFMGSTFAIDSQQRPIFGGIEERLIAPRLGRLNVDGTRDETFSPVVGCCVYQGVSVVRLQQDDEQEKILIGGHFRFINTNFYHDGIARLLADGSVDTTFKGQADAPVVDIEFWQYKMYVATSASLRRYFGDGTLDPSFATVFARPQDIFHGIAIEDDGACIVFGYVCSGRCSALVQRYNSDGTLDTNFTVIVSGDVDDYVNEVEVLKDGSLLIAGRFTNVNCIRRTYLARLIPSDTPDPLPCVPPPPKPEPQLQVTRLRGAKMVCCWPTNYPEYTLQATRRLRPNHPEKEKWVAVTNLPVVGESTVCVTNKIARYGKHYRLVKP